MASVVSAEEGSVESRPLRALIMSSRLEVVPSVVSGAVVSELPSLFLQAAKLSMSTRHMRIQRIAFFIFIIIPLRIFFDIRFAFYALSIEYSILRTKSRVSPKYERTKYGRAVDF